MKKKTTKILLSQLLACSLAVICSATACTPTTPVEPYKEGTTVKFNYEDGVARPLTVEVDEDGKVQEPTAPVQTGFEFQYWMTKSENGQDGEKVTFPFTPTANTELYAKWTAQMCDVTFDLNYEGSENDVVEVEYNKTVAEPTTIPVRDGFTFMYWQERDDGGKRVEFPVTVRNDMSFYAFWVEDSLAIYNIDFNLNYEGAPQEDVPSPFQVIEGEQITGVNLPTKLTRAGYKFIGWGLSADATEKVAPPLTPSDNMTFYAIWEQQTYTVNFRNNYIGAVGVNVKLNYASQKVKGTELATPPEVNPTRPGHTFAGWYTTAIGGTLIDFTKPIVSTTNCYAHWTADEVVTNTFHAEFTYIDPQEKYPGYSGEATGAGIIVDDDSMNEEGISMLGVIHQDSDFEANQRHVDKHGHYISYQYKEGATITFEIYSTVDVNGVTLSANLAAEVNPNMVIAPTGQNAYKVYVNDVELNYGSISFAGKPDTSNGGLFKCPFEVYTLGNVNLKAGKNVIKFVTANSNGAAMGGTMQSVAPIVDCIIFAGYGEAKLSYFPIYDNLWASAL